MRSIFLISVVFVVGFNKPISAQSKGDTLFRAIEARNYSEAIRLVNLGADVNYVYHYTYHNSRPKIPRNPLAILLAPVFILQALVSAIPQSGAISVLDEAITYCDLPSRQRTELITLLLQKGARPNLTGHRVFHALEQKDDSVAKLLIQYGASLNKTMIECYEEITILDWCLFHKNLPMAEWIMKQGTPEQRKYTGSTAIVSAIRSNSPTMLQAMLQSGASFSIGNTSVLHKLAMCRDHDCHSVLSDSLHLMLDELQKNNFNLAAQDDSGNTALHIALRCSKNSLSKELIERYPNLDVTNILGETPLMFAVKAGNQDAVKQLLAKGANSELLNVRGEKCADFALKRKDYELLSMLGDISPSTPLLRTLVIANILKKEGFTPHADSVSRLISEGIVSNETGVMNNCADFFKHTPCTLLGWAVKNDELLLAALLIDAGADPNFYDPGIDAAVLAEAVDNKNPMMVALLMSHGANPAVDDVLNSVDFYLSYSDCESWSNFCLVRKQLLTILLDSGNYLIKKNDAGKFGCVAKNGTVFQKFEFDSICSFAPIGLARAQREGKWGLINFDGFYSTLDFDYEALTDPAYRNDFIGRIALGAKQNGKWGVISSEGWKIIDFQFDNFIDLGDDLAAVEKDGKWGLICFQGKVLMEPEFAEIRKIDREHVEVRKGNHWKKKKFSIPQ